MRTRTTGLLTAALLTAAPLAGMALPASAASCTAPTVVATTASPRSVALAAGGTASLTVSVSVRAGGCTLLGTGARLVLPDKQTLEATLAATSTAGDVTSYTGTVPLSADDLANAQAGSWKVRTSTAWAADAPAPGGTATATHLQGDDDGDDGDDDDQGTGEDEGEEAGSQLVEGEAKVAVLRASQVTSDVTSSALTRHNRIKKGKAVTVRGVLSRADWEKGGLAGYAKQRVELQFRTPEGAYRKVRAVKTGSGGAFAESVKVSKDGCYRVVFTGDATTGADPSTGECVDVH